MATMPVNYPSGPVRESKLTPARVQLLTAGFWSDKLMCAALSRCEAT